MIRIGPGHASINVRSRVLLCLALALSGAALAGCGGGSGDPTTPTEGAMQVETLANTVPHNTPPAPASAADEQVIRLWADTLRRGDVKGAARMFALPSVTEIEPGAPYVELTTRRQALAFNRSLTCGAVLLRTEHERGLTVGVFRLSERPGGYCGSGAGAIARTGFVIEQGRITHWIRLPNKPADNRTPQVPPATTDTQTTPLV